MDSNNRRTETKQYERTVARSTAAIGESEEWLFTALQSIGDAVIATDAAGMIVYMNLVAVKLTGWSEEEAQGLDCRSVFQIINETTRLETESPVTKVIRDGIIAGLANHTILVARDGTEHNIDDSGSPIRGKDGALIGVVLIFRDISDRRRAEQIRNEQQEILQTLFDHIPVMITFLDQRHRFKWVNREWLRVVGWSLEEMSTSERIQEFYPTVAGDRRSVMEPQESQAQTWCDLTVTIKDSSTLQVSWATLRLSDGSHIGIGQDISERKRAEAMTSQNTAQIEMLNRRLKQAMRETDHRVKNNLQSIAALLDLQVMANEATIPVRALTQVRTHINTLASIHDMLVADVMKGVTVDRISAKSAVQKLLPMLQQIVGTENLQWRVDELELTVKQAVSLVMLINELVNNAVKHGGRKVELTLARQEEGVTLEVLDDGPGFPVPFDPEPSAHYGLELVESVGRIDLGGHVTYGNRAQGGACVRVIFPAPEVTAASL